MSVWLCVRVSVCLCVSLSGCVCLCLGVCLSGCALVPLLSVLIYFKPIENQVKIGMGLGTGIKISILESSLDCWDSSLVVVTVKYL